MRTDWLKEIFFDIHAYLWAPAAGVVAGIAFGWLAGVLVAAAFAGLLFGIGQVAKKVIARSLDTKVPQRPPAPR
jgi:hypothetical protein